MEFISQLKIKAMLDEFQIAPNVNIKDAFDYSICYEPESEDLIQQASFRPLSKILLEKCSVLVEKQVGIYSAIMTPKLAVGLVSNNPRIAVELLIQGRPDIQSTILDAVYENWHTVQGLDIIAETTKRGGSYLPAFVEQFIVSVEKINNSQRERACKVFCLMLISLIKAGIDMQPISGVLNPFCLQHSKLKEAVDLYAILKI